MRTGHRRYPQGAAQPSWLGSRSRAACSQVSVYREGNLRAVLQQPKCLVARATQPTPELPGCVVVVPVRCSSKRLVTDFTGGTRRVTCQLDLLCPGPTTPLHQLSIAVTMIAGQVVGVVSFTRFPRHFISLQQTPRYDRARSRRAARSSDSGFRSGRDPADGEPIGRPTSRSRAGRGA